MSLIADIIVDAQNPDKDPIRKHFAALEVVNIRHPSYGESTSGAYDGGAIGDGVTDDAAAIRAAMSAAAGGYVFFPKATSHWSISTALVAISDAGDFNLVFQEADIRLSATAGDTGNTEAGRNANSLFWASSSNGAIRLFGRGKFTGNWDGATLPTNLDTGIGLNLAGATDDYLVEGSFHFDNFIDYGARFESVSGRQVGTLRCTGSGNQGIAFTNASGRTSLDQLVTSGNRLSGTHAEWSSSSGNPIWDVTIGSVDSRDNDGRQFVASMGGADASTVTGASLTAEDFRINVGTLLLRANGSSSEGMLLRFPYFSADLVDVAGATASNARGIHVHNPNNVQQRLVRIGTVIADGCDTNIYLQGSTTQRLTSMVIEDIISKNAAVNGLFFATSHWCDRARLGFGGVHFNGNGSDVNFIRPMLNSRIELGPGFWKYLGFDLYHRSVMVETRSIDTDGTDTRFYIPPGGMVDSIVVDITAPDGNAAATLLVNWSSGGTTTLYTLKADTTGLREIRRGGADIDGSDTENEKLGTRAADTSTTGAIIQVIAGGTWTGGTFAATCDVRYLR